MDRSAVSDADLATAAAGGDERAFTELMRRHKEPLYRFVRRSAPSPDDAYDIVQEAFVAAWRALDRYDARRPFTTWLFHIAVNKTRDHARKRAVRRFFHGAASLDAPDRPDPADGRADIAGMHERRDELARLSRLIDALPERLRLAFTLQVLEELPQSEVAQILGISVKAVETRVYRARRLLAERLDAETGPPD
ncbi:hypothetical protein CCR85_03925 [Rhodothalassium salexigens]|uniref:RNA polymerase sigma factor n=1 Tax=Rhodothalassium salexigens TaxID=1086 RepID=UPI0019115834|nr:RNA polymerase sigma factor [Rhodothalassium salexigens]MBK5910640.1 hypothetical protein [Rhodothalassium salexigens]MBK5920575.1 hypothetical protein [Rhodothalassium salexigens]